MKPFKIILGTDIDDQVTHVQTRGMRYWRRATLDGNVLFVINSPQTVPPHSRESELDYLPRTYITADVFEAKRVCESVPKGNASLNVLYKLENANAQWKIEPVRRILGSSCKAATIVVTSSEYLNLPPQREHEKPEPLEELYRINEVI